MERVLVYLVKGVVICLWLTIALLLFPLALLGLLIPEKTYYKEEI